MRMSNFISALAFAMTLYGAALAAQGTAAPRAPAPTTRPAAAVPDAVETDCMALGGDVSVLIDRGKTSSNISAARAVFQRGIMECMEGDNESANRMYREAKRLLDSRASKEIASPAKP